jgi:predicted PurR-regulated permease PerM
MTTTQRCEVASWCLAGATLFLVLKVKLLAALLAGLLAHELIHTAAPAFRISGTSLRARKFIVLFLLVVAIVAVATAVGIGAAALTAQGPDSLVTLMQKMADLIETARTRLPDWIQSYLPGTAVEVERVASTWLRDHAGTLKTAGEDFGRGLAHVVAGILIGSLMAFTPAVPPGTDRPLVRALQDRTAMLSRSFRRFAFAQVRISAINTTLTAVYLTIVLPLCGVHLPLVKTLIAVTFFAGLMPLIGNLVSNTVIVVVSLSHSLGAAAGSLLYLVAIHKLEYLVNAQIVGVQLRSRAWELLLAMLALESVFGLPGLVAAPVYYGYLKAELTDKELV